MLISYFTLIFRKVALKSDFYGPENISGQSEGNYITFPDRNEIPAIRRSFYDITKFAGVIGAIYSTPIVIECPGTDNAELFRYRKIFYSINVQVIDYANRMIRHIVAHTIHAYLGRYKQTFKIMEGIYSATVDIRLGFT